MTTTRLRCTASSCYMPVEVGSEVVDRFEDEFLPGDRSDVYEVPEGLVQLYLDSGNFVESTLPEPFSGTMELSHAERTCLLAVLPETGSLSDLRIARSVREQLKGPGTGKRVIELDPQTFRLILGEFQQLDAQGKLPLEWLETYERFIQVR